MNVILIPHEEEKHTTLRIRVIGLNLDKNEAVCVDEVKTVLLLNGSEL